MSFYLDTSFIVTSLTHEPASDGVFTWMNDHAPLSFAISTWVVTEFSAALSMKVRHEGIAAAQHTEILREFDV